LILFTALEFIQNKPTPPHTYGLGRVGTTIAYYIFGVSTRNLKKLL
jgi:hypothetical protein